MPSVLDIANLALSHIGDQATVSDLDPPDGSEQAEHCARFYPLQRRSLLERHAWGFATRRATLAPLAEVPPGPWAYAYALPADMVKVWGVYPAGSVDDSDPRPYELQAGDDFTVLLTNDADPVVRFTIDVEDASRFPPLFVDALSHALGARIAGPILRGDTGRKVAREMQMMAEALLAKAAASDANQQRVEPVHRVPWLTDRAQPPSFLPPWLAQG